jgi:hypothetical protein
MARHPAATRRTAVARRLAGGPDPHPDPERKRHVNLAQYRAELRAAHAEYTENVETARQAHADNVSKAAAVLRERTAAAEQAFLGDETTPARERTLGEMADEETRR